MKVIESENQLDLFDTNEIESKLKSPRDKNVKSELSPKDTDASAFGWLFQIIVGIILTLEHFREIKTVKIEGNTEDIELYFKGNKLPEYVQVKAIQKVFENHIKNGASSSKANAAMDTLINTSNRTKGKYSKLLFVVNYRNLFNLTEAEMDAYWHVYMERMLKTSYNDLKPHAKKFIDTRIKSAQKSLRDSNYMSDLKYFNLNKLSFATVLFSNKSDGEEYSVLEHTLKDLFREIGISKHDGKITQVKDMLKAKYFSNAAIQDDGVHKRKRITIEEIAWRLVFELIDEVPENFVNKIPGGIRGELENYEKNFITKQAERISVINAVISGKKKYMSEHGLDFLTDSDCEEFINEYWKNYKNIFPIDEQRNKLVQQYGIKWIMYRVVNGAETIKNLTKDIKGSKN